MAQRRHCQYACRAERGLPEIRRHALFPRGQSLQQHPPLDSRRGNDYYESGIVRPDLLLRDLVRIFHPELVEEEFVYYKQLK